MAINWQEMKKDASVKVLGELMTLVPGLPSSGSTKVREADLPFYQNYRFYEVTDTAQKQPKPSYVLYRAGGSPDETIIIDGSAKPVHRANELAPLKLSSLNVTEYVSFFFACVQGSEGQMAVIEQIQPPPPEEMTDEQTVTAFNAIKKIIPPRVAARRPDGGFKVDAALLFKGCIFKTEIDVPATGTLQVAKHEIVFGDPDQMGDQLATLPPVGQA